MLYEVITAFFEPSTVALHGLRCADFKGGEDVAILGGGTIGLFTAQWAKILGAKRMFPATAWGPRKWRARLSRIRKSPKRPSWAIRTTRITSYNVCYTKLLRCNSI